MPILLDTNILLRTQDSNTSGHAESVALLLSTYGRPTHPFVICAQVVIEFWVVATRPPDVNGLGLSPADTGSRLDDLCVCVPCLPEPPNIGVLWRDLMRESAVSGRPAHDARLVAFMRAYGISRVITLNQRHLGRFAGVICHTPAEATALGLIDAER